MEKQQVKKAIHPQKETLQASRKIIIKDKDGKVIKVKSVQFEPSKTNQDFAKEVEINNIMDRFTRTGELPMNISSTLVYGDFTQNSDFMSTLNRIKQGKDLFHEINAKLDNKFNDPQELSDFMSDPKNEKQLQQLGIFTKRDEPNDAKTEDPPKTEPKPKQKNTKPPAESEE